MRGRFINHHDGGEIHSIELGWHFMNFAVLDKRTAIEYARNYLRDRILNIDILKIAFNDLEALSLVWKYIDTSDVCVTAESDVDDVDAARKKIAFLANMLRRAATHKPRISIGDDFKRNHLASSFGDIVFHHVYICSRVIHGFYLPLCRVFSFQNHEGVLIIDRDDPFVPFVRHMNYRHNREIVDSHACFNLTSLSVHMYEALNCGAIIRMSASVETLDLNWNREYNESAAMFIRSLQNLRTLSIYDREADGMPLPGVIVDAIASLPRLERLFLRNASCRHWTFLLRLPQLRKLRIINHTIDSYHASAISFLPHLETLVIESSAPMRELNHTRAEISERRAKFTRALLGYYDMLERAITHDVAMMILRMANPVETHECLRESIRSRPPRTRLNAEWKEIKK